MGKFKESTALETFNRINVILSLCLTKYANGHMKYKKQYIVETFFSWVYHVFLFGRGNHQISVDVNKLSCSCI